MESSNEGASSAKRIANVFRGNADGEVELDRHFNVVKIFVTSTGTDFPHERQRLFSVVLPALKHHFRSKGIEIYFVDGHGSPATSLAEPVTLKDHLQRAELVADQLTEISECSRRSPTCFLLCMVGNKYGRHLLPRHISTQLYSRLVERTKTKGAPLDANFLSELYDEDTNSLPPVYILKTATGSTPTTDEVENNKENDESNHDEDDNRNMRTFLELYEKVRSEEKGEDQEKQRLKSTVDAHLHHALHCSTGRDAFSRCNTPTSSTSSSPMPTRILCILRTIEGLNESDINSAQANPYLDVDVEEGQGANCLHSMRERIKEDFKETDNLLQFRIPWSEQGLEPEVNEYNNYLQLFCQEVLKKLKDLVTRSLSDQPLLSSLSKPIQDLYMECLGHARSCRDNAPRKEANNLLEGIDSKQHLERIRELMCSHRRGTDWHGPIFVMGPSGSGKTSLLSSVHSACPRWFTEVPNIRAVEVVRIVRFLGHTPATVYVPLLVQNLFGQISLAFNLTTSQIHPNMDLPALCSHLQNAVEMVSKCNGDVQLVVLLDDVHELKHPRFEDVVLGGLLPWNLPSNVHLICSISSMSTLDTKLLTILQSHSMIKNQLLDLNPRVSKSHSTSEESMEVALRDGCSRTMREDQKEWLMTVCQQCPAIPLIPRLLLDEVVSWTSRTTLPTTNGSDDDDAGQKDHKTISSGLGDDSLGRTTSSLTSFDAILRMMFRKLEERFGKAVISRVAQHLCCTLYGLAETEILELLSVTDDVFSCSTGRGDVCHMPAMAWGNIKNSMRHLLRETQVSNRPLLAWKHRCIGDVVRELYVSDNVARATHSDIANFFLAEFAAEKKYSMSSRLDLSSSSGPLLSHRVSLVFSENDDDDDDTNGNGDDDDDAGDDKVAFNLRKIDQLWYHLLHARNIECIKSVAVCNFGFLFAALCTASVRYVLCILDLVRSQILDFEIELLYYVIKLSMDILCKNPLQFAPVIISWLRSYKEMRLSSIETTVNHAMEWCDSHEEPLLVPLNTWVWNPVPEEALTLKCPFVITCFALSHDKQSVFCSDREKAIHMYCLSSRKHQKTFTGHYGKVVCLHVSHTGRYLISGSEDTTTIVWDIHTSSTRHRISEHIATVTCVSTTLNDSLIISGSEDSRVLIAEMETGKVVYKLEHHRGMISCLFVANDVDILITGAADSAVCVWSLENFTLLNTLFFPCPVINMDVSNDRTFLLVGCEDNKLYLRSLTTGSEIHTIDGHGSPVLTTCIANDNCRALIGCENHCIYTYDLHTTKLLRVYGGHDGPIVGVKVTDNDGFLFTAGGDTLKVWYLSPNPRASHGKDTTAAKKQDFHADTVLCLDISKDGTLGISGSADCTVKVWQLSNSELRSTLEAHTAPVTCVACSSSGLFAVSGSQDKTVRVWGLTLGHIVSAFKEHDSPISAVKVTSDSRKVLSADTSGNLKLWQADSGTVTLSCHGPSSYVDVTTNMKYAVCGSADNFIHIWTLSQDDKKHTVNHKEPILCHALTFDSKHVITGSRDKSLKVWEIITGRLTQVLVGHSAAVTCVDVAPLNRILVVSGSEDCNLIVWDMQTGHEVHTLSCHTDVITCIQLTVDGHTTVSGSKDQTICVWETQSGQLVTLFNLHYSVLNLAMSFDAGHIMVHLQDCNKLPLVCLHNCPPIDIQAYKRLEKAMEKESSLQAALPRKVHRRILQKEMSLDTYTWAKKYGNFPGGRQHSFSSSLEDFTQMVLSPISSSTQNLHNITSQSKTNLNQTEIFDELQAVWDGTDPTESRPQTPNQSSVIYAGGRRDQSISSMTSLPSADHLSYNQAEPGRNGRELPDVLDNNSTSELESNIRADSGGVCLIL